MHRGYVKNYRKKIDDWEWFTVPLTAHFFEYCNLKANHKMGSFMGVKIPAGTFVSSLEKMAQGTGLTIQQVRTAIKNLKSTQDITQRTTSRYSIITVNNWKKYQADNTNSNKRITNKQQTNNKQITTIKECKNEKKVINIKEAKTKKFKPPTFDEVQVYCSERNNEIDPQAFIDYYEAKGWMIGQNKMKCWKAAVRTWENRGKQSNKKTDITEGLEFN